MSKPLYLIKARDRRCSPKVYFNQFVSIRQSSLFLAHTTYALVYYYSNAIEHILMNDDIFGGR